MDVEKKVDVLADNKITGSPSEARGTGKESEKTPLDPTSEYYSIDKDLEFNLSYGVTKISIKGFYPLKLGGRTLAFYNDLSLKRLFESDSVRH